MRHPSNTIDHCSRLNANSCAAVRDKLDAASALRDNLELYTSGPIYPVFLKKLIPIFISLLKGPPVFTSTSLEQKLRNCILEILHRLPANPPETFQPFAEEVVDLLISLVRVDNEENASICVKTIMDIMRHQVAVCGAQVQPFLTLIQELFDQMESVVRDQLDNSEPIAANSHGVFTPGNSLSFQNSPRPGSPVASAADLGSDPQQQTKQLLRGMASFKVLAECPIIVVSIFQVYRS